MKQEDQKKEDHKKKRRIIIIPAVILLIAAAVFFYIRVQVGKTNYLRDEDVERLEEIRETAEEETKRIRPEDIYSTKDVKPVPEELTEDTFTLLIVGVGTPEGEEERSDAEAVITMTVHHGREMCFFLNYNVDTYVEIPGYSPGGLGHAYALGGGPLLAETLLANYGLPVDHYTAISLKDVAEVIGMPEFETIDISTQGLDVVAELVYQLGDLNPVQVASYISELLPFVTHNMTPQDVLSLALQIPRIIPYYSERCQIPLEGMYTQLEGIPVPEAGPMSEKMQQQIYGQ